MEFQFRDWFACPECDERDQVSGLAHDTDIVFECYECGTISEFTFGEDPPLQDVDVKAIRDRADERSSG